MGTSGKHNADEVLLGIHTTPEFKAMAFAVAKADRRNLTDEIIALLTERGKQLGLVLPDGTVPGSTKDAVVVGALLIRQRKQERQQREGVKRI